MLNLSKPCSNNYIGWHITISQKKKKSSSLQFCSSQCIDLSGDLLSSWCISKGQNLWPWLRPQSRGAKDAAETAPLSIVLVPAGKTKPERMPWGMAFPVPHPCPGGESPGRAVANMARALPAKFSLFPSLLELGRA